MSSFYAPTTDIIRLGTHSNDVAELQTRINHLNERMPEGERILKEPLQVDGQFGEQMLKAVRAVQKRADLKPDGLVGMQFWKGIAELEKEHGIGYSAPLDTGRVTSVMGLRRDPFRDTIASHKGYDIAAPHGTPVYPTKPGEVVFAGTRGAYGNAIVVRHSDPGKKPVIETIYGHLSGIDVEVGDTVNTAQPIGKVGSTGRSTGNHLHYELRIDGVSIATGDERGFFRPGAYASPKPRNEPEPAKTPASRNLTPIEPVPPSGMIDRFWYDVDKGLKVVQSEVLKHSERTANEALAGLKKISDSMTSSVIGFFAPKPESKQSGKER